MGEGGHAGGGTSTYHLIMHGTKVKVHLYTCTYTADCSLVRADEDVCRCISGSSFSQLQTTITAENNTKSVSGLAAMWLAQRTLQHEQRRQGRAGQAGRGGQGKELCSTHSGLPRKGSWQGAVCRVNMGAPPLRPHLLPHTKRQERQAGQGWASQGWARRAGQGWRAVNDLLATVPSTAQWMPIRTRGPRNTFSPLSSFSCTPTPHTISDLLCHAHAALSTFEQTYKDIHGKTPRHRARDKMSAAAAAAVVHERRQKILV